MGDFYFVLGGKLREIRLCRDRSMSWVAKKIGMSVSNYRRIEMSSIHIDINKFKDICDVLEVDFKEVMFSIIDEM